MEFDFRSFPTQHALQEVATRFPELDLNAAEILLLFMRTSREIYTDMSARLSQYGLSQGKFSVLMLLYRNRENHLMPSQLAELAGVTRGTMTGLLDGLERDRLIERSTHSADRRMITTCLTEMGQQLIEKILPDYIVRTAALLSILTPSERDSLVTLLKKLKSGLEHI